MFFTQTAQRYYEPMMDDRNWNYGDGMWIFMLIFFALLILGAVYFVKNQNNPKDNNPLEIAKNRYAKGEIKKEEFEQLIKDLK